MKIFGIGMSKTGTTSLTSALKILKFNVIHHPWNSQFMRQFDSQNFNIDKLFFIYDGITECPFYFEDFDKQYPNSKFILTYRDPQKWLRSIERWYANDHKYSKEFRIAVFGRYKFNKKHFLQTYLDYKKKVLHYFKHRSSDLLILKICHGEGWDKLCRFLNKPNPPVNFPHKNKNKKILIL